jgi:hypothetical protein
MVTVDVARQAIKDSPPYDPAVSLDREHAARIHGHYGREESRRREVGYEPVIPHLGP